MNLWVFIFGFIIGYTACLVCLYYYEKYPEYLDRKRENGYFAVQAVIDLLKGGTKTNGNNGG